MYAKRENAWKTLVGMVFGGLAILTVFVGFAPAEAASPLAADTASEVEDCPPYFVFAVGEGTTIFYAPPANWPDDCEPVMFSRACGGRLFEAVESVAVNLENSCNPEAWPAYSCSLSIISEPTVVPDDFCNQTAWPADSCGIVIHSADGDEDFGPCNGDLETYRQHAVDEMLLALQYYNEKNGTYWVADAGSKGTGHGWGFYEGDSVYVTSIASALRDGGHLSAKPIHDPLWMGSTDIIGDVLVYRCKHRVAVFTRHGEGQPTPEDRAWWDDNDCFRYPIDRLNAKYFKLSTDPDPERYRESAVNQMVLALGSYGAEHGTYWVAGAGSGGTGHGWGFYQDDSVYNTSIASVLEDGGHFDTATQHDPLWTGSDDIVGDVLVYRCQDRVAVFTRHGEGQPSDEDRAWWDDNDCFRYPIDRLDAKYFRLSGPVAVAMWPVSDLTVQ